MAKNELIKKLLNTSNNPNAVYKKKILFSVRAVTIALISPGTHLTFGRPRRAADYF